MPPRRSLALLAAILFAPLVTGCQAPTTKTFGEDLRYLTLHVSAVVLADASGKSQVIVVPKYQGRVMTSTSDGPRGQSNGYINYELITSGKHSANFNPFGGEERLAVGPEGGQFGVAFSGATDFTEENFHVPAPLDTEAFEILDRRSDRITMRKKFTLTNYSNKAFQLSLLRTVKLLSADDAWKELGAKAGPGATIVAYETTNTLGNFSGIAWKKEEGLLSIATISSLVPSPSAVAIIPLRQGTAKERGAGVTMGGKTFENVSVLTNAVLFRASGVMEKVGVSPKRTSGVVGAYDAATGTLTVIQFMPFAPAEPYTATDWNMQANPFAGDAVTVSGHGSYFELRTNSPALALEKWESGVHTVRTFHLHGNPEDLNPVARAVFGLSIEEISAAFTAHAK